jgi:hydrogenase expression/formation protein HypC
MCLAIPARVTELHPDETATVDLDGVKHRIQLALVEDVRVGDYVIIHTGFALTRLDPEEAQRTLELFAELGAAG